MEINNLLQRVIAFRDARDWQQFHSPAHLAAAISIESAELQEQFLWKTPEQVSQQLADPAKREIIADELADILILTLTLAHELKVSPSDAILNKLAKNAVKYPVEKSKGSASKYTEL